MANRKYADFGRLLTRLMRNLAAVKDWSMRETMAYIEGQTSRSADSIYRWQRGHSCPTPETLECLAAIGKREAALGRNWGEEFLKVTRHPDAANILSTIWGPRENRPIYCNLPTPAHTELIGRHAEIAHILKLLSPQYAAHLVTVDGIGGVGKTALVIEVAHRCWRASLGELTNQKAKELFQSAWHVAEKATLGAQVTLAMDNSFLYICCREYAQAQYRLEQASTLLEKAGSNEPDYIEKQINIKYDIGVMYYEKHAYDQAAGYFNEAIEQAEAFGWQRVAIYSKNYLADIAIFQGRASEAESLLQEGLATCIRNKDKRRIAFYKRSYAYLELKRGNIDEARRWAQEARESFENLGMRTNAEAMLHLLQEPRTQELV